jgi:hypothetical protein
MSITVKKMWSEREEVTYGCILLGSDIAVDNLLLDPVRTLGNIAGRGTKVSGTTTASGIDLKVNTKNNLELTDPSPKNGNAYAAGGVSDRLASTSDWEVVWSRCAIAREGGLTNVSKATSPGGLLRNGA